MNIKAIIASLVLGSSSLAVAAPAAQMSFRPAVPVYSQPVRNQPIYNQPSHGGWTTMPAQIQVPVALASGLTFQGAGRKLIAVNAQAGRFGKLEINASGGRTYIQQVYIQFANGQEQVIRNLNRTLTPGECLTLDLDGNKRSIKRIMVYGSDMNTRWRRAPGSFSVTAA